MTENIVLPSLQMQCDTYSQLAQELIRKEIAITTANVKRSKHLTPMIPPTYQLAVLRANSLLRDAAGSVRSQFIKAVKDDLSNIIPSCPNPEQEDKETNEDTPEPQGIPQMAMATEKIRRLIKRLNKIQKWSTFSDELIQPLLAVFESYPGKSWVEATDLISHLSPTDERFSNLCCAMHGFNLLSSFLDIIEDME